MLMQLVIESMKAEDVAARMVLADFLEIECKETPEKHKYVTLLRVGTPTPNDYLSIIDKFGAGQERKRSQRVRRKFPSEKSLEKLHAKCNRPLTEIVLLYLNG